MTAAIHCGRAVFARRALIAAALRRLVTCHAPCSQQSGIANRLQRRKMLAIERTSPQVTATRNFGCLKQLAAATDVPGVHTVELLDWAMGGPVPPAMNNHRD